MATLLLSPQALLPCVINRKNDLTGKGLPEPIVPWLTPMAFQISRPMKATDHLISYDIMSLPASLWRFLRQDEVSGRRVMQTLRGSLAALSSLPDGRSRQRWLIAVTAGRDSEAWRGQGMTYSRVVWCCALFFERVNAQDQGSALRLLQGC